MLELALPNGTLQEHTMVFFKTAGITLELEPRCYTAIVQDSRITRATFMRPQSIPLAVQMGCCDLGVLGSDQVAETACKVTVLEKLDFSGRGNSREFRVVLFGAKDDRAQSINDIPNGCTIFSEFPRLTRRALVKARVRAKVVRSFGTTEANVPWDFPYGVCITSTGETLEANGLKVIEVLSVDTTVIIGGCSWLDGGPKEDAVRSLLADLIGKGFIPPLEP